MDPSDTAVVNCFNSFDLPSPATNTPGVLASQVSPISKYPASSVATRFAKGFPFGILPIATKRALTSISLVSPVSLFLTVIDSSAYLRSRLQHC